MLILHDLQPLHWAPAGAAIGAIALLMLWLGNRRLGRKSCCRVNRGGARVYKGLLVIMGDTCSNKPYRKRNGFA